MTLCDGVLNAQHIVPAAIAKDFATASAELPLPLASSVIQMAATASSAAAMQPSILTAGAGPYMS
jgi:hypothetical protein